MQLIVVDLVISVLILLFLLYFINRILDLYVTSQPLYIISIVLSL